MEGEESLLDSIFDAENVEDMEDVDMVDVEEGELVENNHEAELAQSTSVDGNPVAQSKNKRNKNRKKKNKKKKGGSGSDVTDINRFVLDTCRRLKEKKSYLIWTAVGCLGVAALSDLVKEVDAIQACGGQKTADGRRYRVGGGILWSILKARDPNAFKEIMKKGKEFEKQFNKTDLRKAANEKKATCSQAKAANENKGTCSQAKAANENKGTCSQAEGGNKVESGELCIEEKESQKRRPVHERIRVPVSYDDLLQVE